MGSTELNPELEALLSENDSKDEMPDFSDLFKDEAENPQNKNILQNSEDFSKESFPTIKKYEQESDPVFFSNDYYKKVLSGEDESATRVHNLLQKYLKADDP